MTSADFEMDDPVWVPTTQGKVKRNEVIKVAWSVGTFRFVAMGIVEEKPHGFDPGDKRLRLKLRTVNRSLHIVDTSDFDVLQTEAGFGWDGWLVVPGTAKFHHIPSEQAVETR